MHAEGGRAVVAKVDACPAEDEWPELRLQSVIAALWDSTEFAPSNV